MKLATRLTAFALVFGLASVPAQSGITVMAGIASTSLSIDIDGFEEDDFDSKMGVAAGVGISHTIGESLTFNPELLYVMKGIKSNESDSEGKEALNYVELPLLVRYTFSGGRSATPFITAGPTVAFLASCTFTFSDGDSESCDDVFGPEDSFKSTDFGFAVGAGVVADRISAHARYVMGLTNIDKAEGYTTKNKALMFLLGYSI